MRCEGSVALAVLRRRLELVGGGPPLLADGLQSRHVGFLHLEGPLGKHQGLLKHANARGLVRCSGLCEASHSIDRLRFAKNDGGAPVACRGHEVG